MNTISRSEALRQARAIKEREREAKRRYSPRGTIYAEPVPKKYQSWRFFIVGDNHTLGMTRGTRIVATLSATSREAVAAMLDALEALHGRGIL